MKIQVNKTGNIIKGHLLDVSIKPFVQALKDYDAQLYVKWNGSKIKGHGCWEIRRKPEMKTVKPQDVVVCGGNTFVCPRYHETNLENHVLDLPYLNYQALGKLQSMDMWTKEHIGYKGKNLTRELDYREAKHLEAVDEKSAKELEYNLKQHASEIRYFREYVLSGQNPYRLADYWPKT